MTERERFILALRSMADSIDFFHGLGGSGAEFVCTSLCEKSDLYPNYTNEIGTIYSISAAENGEDVQEHLKLNRGFMTINRYGYTDKYFGNFFLKVSMYSRNHEVRFDTFDDLYDIWNNLMMDESDARPPKGISTFRDKALTCLENFKANHPGKRMLCRTHGAFIGLEHLFPNSRNIWLTGKNLKWNTYCNMMVDLKVFAGISDMKPKRALEHYSYTWDTLSTTESNTRKTAEMRWGKENYVAPADRPFINKEIFMERIKLILDAGEKLYAFYPIALMMPERIFKPNPTLIKDVLAINPFELNTLEFYLTTPRGKLLSRYLTRVDFDDWMSETSWDKDNVFCISDLLFDDTFPKSFGIDPKEFQEEFMGWHERNLDLVAESEKLISSKLLPNEDWMVK